jgi:hypothetical protein
LERITCDLNAERDTRIIRNLEEAVKIIMANQRREHRIYDDIITMLEDLESEEFAEERLSGKTDPLVGFGGCIDPRSATLEQLAFELGKSKNEFHWYKLAKKWNCWKRSLVFSLLRIFTLPFCFFHFVSRVRCLPRLLL